MSRDQRVLKRRRGATQAKRQARHLHRAPVEFDLALLAKSTYLNVDEAVAYLRFPSVAAFYHWIERYRVPRGRTGRKLLFLRRDLDEAVQPLRLLKA